MFFADFSVNSEPIFMKFSKEYLQVPRHIGPTVKNSLIIIVQFKS